MPFDTVHDIQQGYRRIVFANSFPGRVVSLSDLAERIEPHPPFNPLVLLLALTLLDGETTFAVCSQQSGRDERIIGQRTFAKVRPVDQAAFLFSIGPEAYDPELVRNARIGTLVDPHLGATLIIEVDSLGVSAGSGVQIHGPGIDGHAVAYLGSNPWWLPLRNERVGEFPLGIDLYLIDPTGGFVALPRSTRIAGNVAESVVRDGTGV